MRSPALGVCVEGGGDEMELPYLCQCNSYSDPYCAGRHRRSCVLLPGFPPEALELPLELRHNRRIV